MKKVLSVLVVLLLAGNVVEAQKGWIQTQLNASGNMGYNLYSTDSELFAATNNGVYSTADSGMPWFSKGPAGHYVYDVIKSGQYILVATNDGVYRSSDNGTTWLATNGSPTFVGTGQAIGPRLFAKNSTYVFAIAWAAGVFRSGDDGNSWQKLTVGTRPGYAGDIGGFSSCICAAGENVLIGVQVGSPVTYYTLDNGMTWESRSMSAQMPGDLVFLRYADGQLFAGGFTGLFLSTDLGNSWTARYSNTITPEGKMVGLGIFRDVVTYKRTLIAAVDFNSIQLSRDNGMSWTSFNEGLISDWTFSALAVSSSNVWALTHFFGNAYRRSLAEIVTGVEKYTLVIPSEYSLHQNYPNPFNPATIISFSLSSPSFVSLKVLDIIGREVATVVSEEMSAGTYSRRWNAANMSSGIYFYRIQAGTFTQTKKLVLLR